MDSEYTRRLDMANVNENGETSNNGKWAKIQLDKRKYGNWSNYGGLVPTSCPRDTGQQTETAASWTKKLCLGSKARVLNCSLAAVNKNSFSYDNCDYTQQKQQKISGCLKSWVSRSKRIDCANSTLKE